MEDEMKESEVYLHMIRGATVVQDPLPRENGENRRFSAKRQEPV